MPRRNGPLNTSAKEPENQFPNHFLQCCHLYTKDSERLRLLVVREVLSTTLDNQKAKWKRGQFTYRENIICQSDILFTQNQGSWYHCETGGGDEE